MEPDMVVGFLDRRSTPLDLLFSQGPDANVNHTYEKRRTFDGKTRDMNRGYIGGRGHQWVNRPYTCISTAPFNGTRDASPRKDALATRQPLPQSPPLFEQLPKSRHLPLPSPSSPFRMLFHAYSLITASLLACRQTVGVRLISRGQTVHWQL